MPPAPGSVLLGADVGLEELGRVVGSALVLAGRLGTVTGELAGEVVNTGVTVLGVLLEDNVMDGADADGSPEVVRAGDSVSVPPSSPAQEVKQLAPNPISRAMDQAEVERIEALQWGVVFMSRADG